MPDVPCWGQVYMFQVSQADGDDHSKCDEEKSAQDRIRYKHKNCADLAEHSEDEKRYAGRLQYLINKIFVHYHVELIA